MKYCRGAPLVEAAMKGRMNDIKACLDAGTDIESKDDVSGKCLDL